MPAGQEQMTTKSFVARRHESPDFEIEAWITGVRLGTTGKIQWHICIDGEGDPELVAGILERAVEVLRNK